jgi:hypothetical protein
LQSTGAITFGENANKKGHTERAGQGAQTEAKRVSHHCWNTCCARRRGGTNLVCASERIEQSSNVGIQLYIPRKFSVGEQMVLAITVKNFGNTEAHDVTAHSSLVVGPFETDQNAFDTAPLVTADQPDTHTVVPPGDTLQQTLVSKKPLTAEDYSFVSNGKVKIYFISRISYTDSSGKKYGREVCEYFSISTQVMTVCQSHNSSF